MGGRIWVESIGQARAACYRSRCRFEMGPGPGAWRRRRVGADTEPPLSPLHILLVEDSPDNRTITLAYLQDTPYRIDIAENGAVACERIMARTL